MVAQTVFIPGEGMSGAAIGLNYVHDFALSNLKLYGFELGVEIPQSCRRISLTDISAKDKKPSNEVKANVPKQMLNTIATTS